MKEAIRLLALGAALLLVTAGTALPEDDGEIRRLLSDTGDAKKHGGASQVVVFDRTLNRCEENGRSTVTHEVLTKILSVEGARDRSVLTLGYDPKTNRAKFVRVRVFKKGGEVIELPIDPLDIPSPGGIIFWGGRRKLLTVPGLAPGDGLEVVTRTVGFKIAYLAGGDDRYIPPMRGHFYDVVRFWTGTPIIEKTYVLVAPRSKAVRFAVYNGALETALTFEGDEAVYTFRARNLKPYEGETHMVSHWDVAPKLVLTSVPDWPTKSRWFWKVNEPQFKADEAIRRKAKALTKDLGSDEAKVKALVHWVADEVRYLGLSMGKGEGYTTHPATMTFHERAGVCKDKAGLLVSMLRAVGMESYLAMTQVGSRVEAEAADQFNHAVTALKLRDGRFLMLDPTWAPASCEMWSSLEQEQYFVIGTEKGEPRDRAPYFPPEANRLDVSSMASLRAVPGGTVLEGVFTIEAHGYPDTWFRRKIEKSPAGRVKNFFETLLDAVAPGTELRELERTDIRDYSRPVKVVLRWRSPLAVLGTGERGFLRSPALSLLRVLPLVDRVRESAEPGKREHPFNLRNTLLVRFKEVLSVPAGFSWKTGWGGGAVSSLDTEAVAAFGGERYASFSLSRKSRGASLVFEGGLEIARKEVPAGAYSDFRRMVQEMEKAMEAWIEVDRKEGK